jgi:hypothetical protein
MAFVISIIPTTAITTKAITSDILIISDFFIAFLILLVNTKRSPPWWGGLSLRKEDHESDLTLCTLMVS